MILNAAFFQQAVYGITPLLFASLAGSLCAQAGIFNVALEGQMLVGAFAAVAGCHFTGSVLAGAAIALVAALGFAAILAFGSTVLKGDAIVIGITLNLLAASLTAFLLRILLGVSGTYSDPAMPGLPHWPIPGLGAQTALVPLSWVMVAVVSVFLHRTPWGLRVQGAGLQPDAAVSLGVDSVRIRIAVTLVAGLLCGLAGLQLSLGSVTLFAENMTAGRGWIAVVAVMLGRAHPFAVAGACLLFGFADALGLKLQGEGLPSQITDIAPYVITLAALVIARSRIKVAHG